MAPIRAVLHGVSAGDLDELKCIVLPLEAKLLQHDGATNSVSLTVPCEAAFAALQALPQYTVERVESPWETIDSRSPVVSSSLLDDTHTTPGLREQQQQDQAFEMRKPLPSSDIFYLLTDRNMVAPFLCLLLLVHTIASLCFFVWSPPLITALLPVAALLLLRALNQREIGGGSKASP